MIMSTQYAGIDYGRGLTNVDHETGIRYGVISQHEVLQAWADSSEADYGEPHCPKCGNEAIVIPSHTESSDPPGAWVRVIQDIPDAYEDFETEPHACGDFACESCKYLFDGDEAFGEEPIGFNYDGDGYQMHAGSDGDIFVIKSLYYTRAQFCSPCAPGAGYLMNPCDEGPKTYCLDHEWFEDGKAPYPVFRVADDTEVLPAE